MLPYTVGVFVANAVVAYRKARRSARATRSSTGSPRRLRGQTALPELEKRYLFFGGRRTLWDIALTLHRAPTCPADPFAPRKLTWKERLTGELEE